MPGALRNFGLAKVLTFAQGRSAAPGHDCRDKHDGVEQGEAARDQALDIGQRPAPAAAVASRSRVNSAMGRSASISVKR